MFHNGSYKIHNLLKTKISSDYDFEFLWFSSLTLLNRTPPFSLLFLSSVRGMLEKTMKTSSTMFQDKYHNHSTGKRERCLSLTLGKGVPFVLTSLLMASIFSFFFLYNPYPLTLAPHQGHDMLENPSPKQEEHVITTTTKVSPSKPQKGMSQKSSHSRSWLDFKKMVRDHDFGCNVNTIVATNVFNFSQNRGLW